MNMISEQWEQILDGHARRDTGTLTNNSECFTELVLVPVETARAFIDYDVARLEPVRQNRVKFIDDL